MYPDEPLDYVAQFITKEWNFYYSFTPPIIRPETKCFWMNG